MNLLLKLFPSFKCFNSQGERWPPRIEKFTTIDCGIMNMNVSASRARRYCYGKKKTKTEDPRLDGKQRCIKDARPHLALNKDLSLHLQSTGGRRSLRLPFSSHVIICRLHLGIIVFAGQTLAPFERVQIRAEIFCLAR